MSTTDPTPPTLPDDPAALAARVRELESKLARRNAGRRPSKPTTPDARLVARVLALGWTRAGLCVALGYKTTSTNVLSRCNGPSPVPLTEETRTTLKRMAVEGVKPQGGEST